jgi:2-dehydro-3-deoxyphosphooctonate aldolase (KDO 8-P synthase)
LGGKSGGDRQFAPYLAKAAAAVGVDGFFIETHPHPEKALSDGPNMVPLEEMKQFLTTIHNFWKLQQQN